MIAVPDPSTAPPLRSAGTNRARALGLGPIVRSDTREPREPHMSRPVEVAGEGDLGDTQAQGRPGRKPPAGAKKQLLPSIDPAIIRRIN